MNNNRIKNYDAFWPFYLSEHSRPATRHIHAIGTLLGLALGGLAFLTQIWWLLLAALVTAYGAAWTSHALIEKNTPATFKYPFWSFISDFRMLGLWLQGKLQAECDRYNSDTPPSPSRDGSNQQYKSGKWSD